MQPSSPRTVRHFAEIVAVLAVLIVAMPSSWKRWMPAILQAPRFHLGLDLAGGTQLDFRLSEDEINDQIDEVARSLAAREANGAPPQDVAPLQAEQQILLEQKRNLIEAIRVVLERRLNALGVSETTITPSYVGNEKHILVECPGVVDPQKCIDTVGKTIQLEFKEEFTEPTETFAVEVRENVRRAQERLQKGESLATVGQDIGDELGVQYVPERPYFRTELPTGLAPLWTASPQSGILRREGELSITTTDEEGKQSQRNIPGIFLAEIVRPKTQTGTLINEAPKAFQLLQSRERGSRYALREHQPLEALPQATAEALQNMSAGDLRTAPGENGAGEILFLRLLEPAREEVDVSHILVAYRGAIAADVAVQRTKAEAREKIQSIQRRLRDGENFERLARQESDGPSRKDSGRLGSIARGETAPMFEKAAFGLQPGIVSDPVETPYGFHLLRVNSQPALATASASFDVLSLPGPDGLERAGILLSALERGDVRGTEDVLSLRFLFFSLVPSGWQDTSLDGKHFRTASVVFDPTTNFPVVSIQFDEEGGKIFQELTRKNVGRRIAIFVGGQRISAPVVQEEIIGGSAIISGSRNVDEARRLSQDLNTGAIPAPIHLVGQRTVEASLGADSLRASVLAGIVGLAVVLLYMLVMYRLLGLVACAALVFYCLLFLVFLKLPLFLFSGQYVILTLAGFAGSLLSTGMAIDANVLIFERIKEELRKGKPLTIAVETGFAKSWSAIWDSNLTTIITCIILFVIGTSIVRGFALTLGFGVLLSLFTAITVTRWLLRALLLRLRLTPSREAFLFGFKSPFPPLRPRLDIEGE